MKSVTPRLTGMFKLTGETFTSIFSEILLKKVRHRKCDPLFDRDGPVNWQNLHIYIF